MMQPLSSFSSSLGTAVLLIGPSGGGKTVLACRLFPKTYVLISDLNFESAKRYLGKINETSNIVGIDTVDVDEAGAVVPLNTRYARLFGLLDKATKDPAIETIVLDSLTFMADSVMAKLTMSTTIDSIVWSKEKGGDYLRIWRSLLNSLRTSGKRLVLIAHEKVAKGQMDEILFNQVNLWGGFRDMLPIMVSDVWRCEVQNPKLPGGKPTYMVRVVGNTQNKLKNNFGWETPEMTSEEVIKQVRATLV